ncbi:MAG: glycosyltransferase family 39 protein, partial [Deltaproteobacteria bacterium]|nr:glycosyltransferase family 39 protein [Deltaproteobacteria bacterium]
MTTATEEVANPAYVGGERRVSWAWPPFVLLAAVFSVVCLRGVAAPWHWGHNGYMGAAFSQAARNSLRFGIVGQAPYHFGAEPPSPEAIYTHHPLGLHAHVIAAFLIFGEHEWAARLTPVIHSVATLILLVFAVRRYWDVETAWLTGLLYLLTPLNVIFANMVAHQQGGMFWSLAAVVTYLRWLETGTRRYAAFCAAAITLAAQFDWPGYYVAFAIAVHCGVLGLRGAAPRSWIRFLFAFSAVTLVNMLGFFVWIYATRGDLSDMANSFMLRRASPPLGAYLALLYRRLALLYGPALLLAAVVGAITAWRACRSDGLQSRALLPLGFGFAGLVNVVAFPHAAELHSYWTYYWSPTVALLAAIGLVAAARWFSQGQRSASWSVALIAGFAALQGARAWHTSAEQFEHGHAADCQNCYFQRYEREWFVALGKLNEGKSVEYAIHSSVREPRIELLYYLDSPYVFLSDLKSSPGRVLLVDEYRLSEADQEVMRRYRSAYPHSVWMDRFYAVDFRAMASGRARFAAVDRDVKPWRW